MDFVRAALFSAGLFAGVLILLRVGWMLGQRRVHREGPDSDAGQAPIEGAIFAMMGLLIAFTFTSAASRFDDRRTLVGIEVNAIGTAWLRLDLLPRDRRVALQDLFRQYLDARIALYKDFTDTGAVALELQRTSRLQQQIWERLVAAMSDERLAGFSEVLLPAANDMFDIAQSRKLATRRHPPFAIFFLLAALILVSALFAGHAMGKARSQSLLHVIGFAGIASLATYLILDLEYPRLGLVRVDAVDRALVELRQSMG
jgi:hypothetical protein